MSQPVSHASDPLIGTMIGNYRIAKKLGQGGMGAVYLAEHVTLSGLKQVVKVIRAEYAATPAIVQRFFAEAGAMSRLEHMVLDHGTLADGAPYMCLEYIKGHPLSDEKTPMPIDRAMLLVVQVLGALAVAHDRGIIHRDIKPENVMVVPAEHPDREPDRAKVLDFGIAKLLSQTAMDELGAGQTGTSAVMGTPLFMSPEQARGSKNVTPASDLYSVGVMLFQLLCGRLPYQGNTLGEIIHAHITQPLPDPWDVQPQLPRAIRDVIRAAMAPDSGHRPESAMALAELLVTATPGGQELARTVGFVPTGNVRLPARSQITQTPAMPSTTFGAAAAETRDIGPPRPGSRKPWALAAAIVIVLGVVGGGIALLSRSADNQPPAAKGANATSIDASTAAPLPPPDGARAGVGAATELPVDAGTAIAVIDAGGPDAVVNKLAGKKKRRPRRKKRKRRNSSGVEDITSEGWGELRIRK